ncbi:MAG TPA: T9SS type A sorting domain-containing protein, partial [Bacteroidia bacterium]|nr:T9SS type A sorting domain-containing protein [Bacteroidia bacterium]
VYTTGPFYGPADFDPGPGTVMITPTFSTGIFILKLDASGNFVWVKDLEGGGNNKSYSITLDPSANIYAAGYFESTMDFDPGPGTFTLPLVGFDDAFIFKLDSAGNFIWAGEIAGPESDYAYSVVIDGSDNLYLTGGYSNTTDFDPGAGVDSITSTGYNDIYIMKMSQVVVTAVNENNLSDNIHAFPNPSNGKVNLSFDHSLDHAMLLLFNTTGQKVMGKTNISGKQFSLDLSELADGIYYVEINDSENNSRIKVVKD